MTRTFLAAVLIFQIQLVTAYMNRKDEMVKSQLNIISQLLTAQPGMTLNLCDLATSSPCRIEISDHGDGVPWNLCRDFRLRTGRMIYLKEICRYQFFLWPGSIEQQQQIRVIH